MLGQFPVTMMGEISPSASKIWRSKDGLTWTEVNQTSTSPLPIGAQININ